MGRSRGYAVCSQKAYKGAEISEHLQLWQQELRDTVTDKNNENKTELKEAKKKIRTLEKEIDRKDKTLAELAALIVLKKKVHQIWEENKDE